MTDDNTKPVQQERERINVHEPRELNEWSRKLGVTEDELRVAVRDAGPKLIQVKKWLRK